MTLLMITEPSGKDCSISLIKLLYFDRSDIGHHRAISCSAVDTPSVGVVGCPSSILSRYKRNTCLMSQSMVEHASKYWFFEMRMVCSRMYLLGDCIFTLMMEKHVSQRMLSQIQRRKEAPL